MLRTRVTRRLAAFIAAAAFLALPASASAAAAIDLEVTVPPTLEANGLNPVVLTITNNGPDPATPGTVTLNAESGASVVGTPAKSGPGSLVTTVTNGSFVVTAGAIANGDTATIIFQVRTPKTYDEDFGFRATGTGGSYAGQNSGDWKYAPNVKGGPSRIIQRLGELVPSAGVTGSWATIGGTVTSTLTVTNHGSGAGHYVTLDIRAGKYNSEIFSPVHVPENPDNFTLRFNSGTACVPIAPEFTKCEIETLAPGATIAVPIVSSPLTHYGTISAYANNNVPKADDGDDSDVWIGNDYVSNDVNADSITVTDGSQSTADVEVNGPKAGPPNTSLTYSGMVVNNGPSPIVNGVLRISAPTFFTNGSNDNRVPAGTANALPSIESVTTAFGATCVRATERWDDGGTWKIRELLDMYDCPVASLAPGARAGFTVVAKFQTTRVSTADSSWNVQGGMSASIYTRGHNPRNGLDSPTGYITTYLNPTQVIDLQVSVASQALVGADRAGVQKVTIRNAGTYRAKYVTLEGRAYAGGAFETSIMPAACTGVLKPIAMHCILPDLMPGESISLDVPVRAGKKLGTLITSYEVGHGSGLEFEDDNNSIAHTMQIVKANAVPLLGVVVAKPKATGIATVGKSGLKTKVKTPGAASVKVNLILPARTALAMGLIKKPKKGIAKDLVIGTSTTKATKAGDVTATTKFSKKFAKRLMAAKSKLTVKREVVVVSTAPLTAGASAKSTVNLALTPAKKKK